MSAVTFNVILGGSVIYGIGCIFWLMYALMDWDFAYGDDKRKFARRAFATPIWPGLLLWLGVGFVRNLWVSAFGPTEEEKARRLAEQRAQEWRVRYKREAQERHWAAQDRWYRSAWPDPSNDRHHAFRED